jgi:hypothetical protein
MGTKGRLVKWIIGGIVICSIRKYLFFKILQGLGI